MITVMLVEPNEDPTVKTVEPTLEALRGLIDGGYLEAIGGPGWTAYCDEDGRLNDLPVNLMATHLAYQLGWPQDDVLRGPVIFLGSPDKDGDDTSVTADVLRLVGSAHSLAVLDGWPS